MRARWAAVAIIAIAVALSAHASCGLSPPTDEFSRITSGIAYLRLGDFRMDFATPPLFKYLVAAPLLGQHTDEVFGELLGLSAGELNAYRDQGVIE